jgi:hypothetical protein
MQINIESLYKISKMWCWDRKCTRSLPVEIELGATHRIQAEGSSDWSQNYGT